MAVEKVFLSFRFTKLVKSASFLGLIVIPAYFLQTSAAASANYLSIVGLISLLLLLIFQFFHGVKILLLISENGEIEKLSSIWNLSWSRQRFLREDIDRVVVKQLASRYYVLNTVLKNGNEIPLLETINRRKMKQELKRLSESESFKQIFVPHIVFPDSRLSQVL